MTHQPDLPAWPSGQRRHVLLAIAEVVHAFSSKARRLVAESPLPEIWVVLLIGMLIRGSLWIYSSQADLSTFASISQALTYGYKPYSTLNIYPPGWNLFLGLVGRLVSLVVSPGQFLGGTGLASSLEPVGLIEPSAIVAPQYSVIEKSALALFDVASGLLLVTLARDLKIGGLRARTIFAAWFLNPLVITVSAVQGNYDVISVTLVLAALYLAANRSWLFSGIALSIGGLFSLYPFFLLPLVAAYAIRSQARPKRWRPPIWLGLGVGAALGVVLWPPLMFSSFVTDLTTGPNVGLAPGGFWFWSVMTLPGFSQFGPELSQFSALVVVTCAVVTVSVLLGIVGSFLLGRSAGTPKILFPYVGLSVIMTYTLLPITQPQNLLWVLPFALFLAVEQRTVRLMFMLLSILPVIFFWIGLGGPLYLLQGLAVYTSVLPQSTVVRSVLMFTKLHYIWFPVTEVPTFAVLVLLADKLAWKTRTEAGHVG